MRAPRGPARLRGRGGYFADLWNSGRKYIPRVLGGAAGLMAGHPETGWDLGADFSKKILGWGAYSVNDGRRPGGGRVPIPGMRSNSLVFKGNVPTFARVGGGEGIRLCHTEPLCLLSSTASFTNRVYTLNPGIATTFPWLSKLAANFTTYKFNGVSVSYQPMLTNAVATFSSIGIVCLASDVNPANQGASTLTNLEQYKFAAYAKANESIVGFIECAPDQTGPRTRNIRLGAVPSNASIVDYDHGSLQIGTDGMPSAGVVIGQVFISYDVTLYNPKVATGTSMSCHYRCTGVTDALPWGGAVAPTRMYDNLGVQFTSVPSSTFTIGSGVSGGFMLIYAAHGTNASTGAIPPTITLTNATAGTTFDTTGANPFNATTAASMGATARVVYASVFNVTSPTLPVTVKWEFDAGFLPSASAEADLMIIPYGDGTATVGCVHRMDGWSASREEKQFDMQYMAASIPVVEEDDGPDSVPVFVGAAAGAAAAPTARVGMLRKAFGS